MGTQIVGQAQRELAMQLLVALSVEEVMVAQALLIGHGTEESIDLLAEVQVG